MRRHRYAIRALSCGAISLGVLQAVQNIDFNQIWFSFLATLFNALVALLFGGDPSGAFNSGGMFGGFFV